MQTSLARRQQRRLNGGRRRGGGGARAVAVGLPLFLFGTLAAFAIVAFIGVVGAYAYFSNGLADPSQLSSIVFNQESTIYDRTGTVVLATFGTERRQTVTFSDLPPSVLDATTAIEDHTFWTNAGFDPVGIVSAALDTLQGNPRGGSTITQQLVRQPPAGPRPRAGSQSDGRTEDQGDHPVDPPDRGLPGRRGQAEDHHRLPQPELLRQQRLRRRSGRPELLRRVRPQQADARPGGHPGRHPAVARRPTTWCATRSTQDGKLVVPQDSAPVIRRNEVLRAMQTYGTPHDRRGRQAVHRSRLRRRPAGAGDPGAPDGAQLEGAAVRVGGPPAGHR